MDAPVQQDTIPALGVMTCAAVGAIGASISSMDRVVTVKQTLWHAGLACFISALFPFLLKALWPSIVWWLAVPCAGAIGLCIYGLAILVRKSNDAVGKINPEKIIKDKTGLGE